MKKSTQKFLKTIAVAVSSVLLGINADAATYTATTSGNFSSSATWQGGNIPPVTLSAGDAVTINPGVTVVMDQNLVMNNNTSSITVMGRIAYSANHYLVITSGTLAGTGSISVDSLAMGGSVINLSISGNDTAQKFTSLGFTIGSAINFYVANRLYLSSGQLSINSGSLQLGSNSTINVNGGTVVVLGGMLNLVNSYNVVYSSAATAGAELQGSGLAKVTVNLSSGAVTLSSGLTMKDTLTLSAGDLVLNSFNLSFAGNGNFSASGSGNINSSSSSNISINSNNNFAGGLRFASGGNAVNNLTINMGSSSVSASLANDLTVNGQLNLQQGKIAAAGTLTVAQGATLNGGSANSYVVTAGNGKLAIYLAASDSAAFQVGTAAYYAPALVAANTTSANGTVSVAVNPSVYLNGTSGTMLSTTESVVDATWYITSSAATGINYNIYLVWNSSMEVNSFDRTQAYIAHYTAGAWDKVAVSSSSSLGAGMYAQSRMNVSSPGPFVVADKNASMTNVAAIHTSNAVSVYPNPATNTLSFKSPVTIDRVEIYNIMGRMVQSSVLSGTNVVTVDALPAGMYNVRFYSNGSSFVQKFVKE
jgi:hypothetical protein